MAKTTKPSPGSFPEDAPTTLSNNRPAGRKLFMPEQMKQFLAQGDIRTAADAQEALKDLFGQTLQALLEGEMDHHLGYAKNDTSARQECGSTNRRNGQGSKSVRSGYGDIPCVPR